jgi:hypothetical protein
VLDHRLEVGGDRGRRRTQRRLTRDADDARVDRLELLDGPRTTERRLLRALEHRAGLRLEPHGAGGVLDEYLERREEVILRRERRRVGEEVSHAGSRLSAPGPGAPAIRGALPSVAQ